MCNTFLEEIWTHLICVRCNRSEKHCFFFQFGMSFHFLICFMFHHSLCVSGSFIERISYCLVPGFCNLWRLFKWIVCCGALFKTASGCAVNGAFEVSPAISPVQPPTQVVNAHSHYFFLWAKTQVSELEVKLQPTAKIIDSVLAMLQDKKIFSLLHYIALISI